MTTPRGTASVPATTPPPSDNPRVDGTPPPGACVAHRPPSPGKPWRRADPGYWTCTDCCNRLHEWLSPLTTDDRGHPDSIPGLYALLTAQPGRAPAGRRAPGFQPRSPGNDHVICMRDGRSSRVLRSDPHSVPGLLAEWVLQLMDTRDLSVPPARTVPAMTRFLDRHLDWITRQAWVADLHAELRELHHQLHAIGAHRRPVGTCPGCRSMLYAPVHGDTIACWNPTCRKQWPRRDWLALADSVDSVDCVATTATAS